MATSPSRARTFEFALIDTDISFEILGFDIQEAMSAPFLARFRLVSLRPDLALTDLLDKAACLTYTASTGQRLLHGHVFQCGTLLPGRSHTLYEMLVVPKLHYLQERITCRIYQDKNIQTIVQEVLQNAGFLADDYRFELSDTPFTRHYCVQYNESDLNFIHRLLAEEGWFYWHEHHTDHHVLVITDNAVTLKNMDGDPTLSYQKNNGLIAERDYFSQARYDAHARPSAPALSDYNAEKPGLDLRSDGHNANDPQLMCIHPANILDDNHLKKIATAHTEQAKTGAIALQVVTSSHRLQHGKRVTLTDHPTDTVNGEWLVFASHETGEQPQALEAWSGSGAMHYTVQAQLHSSAAPFRPRPQAKRPRIDSVQTAVVTGPSGEDIHTDNNGRIKVRFVWDTASTVTHDQNSESNTCWLRVAQTLAGPRWGSVMTPRIGQEVLVSFEHGNPDRPLVIGALYNAVNKPPISLPTEKACTTLTTRTTPNGNTGHRIILDDSKNRENISIRSQKELSVNIQGNQYSQTQGEEHMRISGSLLQKTLGESHRNIQGNALHLSNGETGIHVDKDIHFATQGNHYTQAGRTLIIKAGRRLVVDAGTSLSLKAGAGTVSITAGGTALNGALINLNEGGASAASASSPNLSDTRQPDMPGNADAGSVTKASATLAAPTSALSIGRGGAQEYQLKFAAEGGLTPSSERKSSGISGEKAVGNPEDSLTLSAKTIASPPRDPIVAIVEDNQLKMGVYNSDSVAEMQQALKNAGYNIAVDGDWGAETEAAYQSYLAALSLTAAEPVPAVTPAVTVGTFNLDEAVEFIKGVKLALSNNSSYAKHIKNYGLDQTCVSLIRSLAGYGSTDFKWHSLMLPDAPNIDHSMLMSDLLCQTSTSEIADAMWKNLKGVSGANQPQLQDNEGQLYDFGHLFSGIDSYIYNDSNLPGLKPIHGANLTGDLGSVIKAWHDGDRRYNRLEDAFNGFAPMEDLNADMAGPHLGHEWLAGGGQPIEDAFKQYFSGGKSKQRWQEYLNLSEFENKNGVLTTSGKDKLIESIMYFYQYFVLTTDPSVAGSVIIGDAADDNHSYQSRLKTATELVDMTINKFN